MSSILAIKSDYSLLKSLIKIKDIIPFLLEKKITTCGILDDNLFSFAEFYNSCKKNNIKPIVGLDIILNNKNIYLYAKNYEGYKNLLKINTIIQERDITIYDLTTYKNNIICVIPFTSNELYKDLIIFEDLYISYKNEYEKQNSSIITNKIIFLNIIKSLNMDDTKFINYLDSISTGNELVSVNKYIDNYYKEELNNEEFINLIDIEIPTGVIYMPKYQIENSYNYLISLCKKGLEKRIGTIKENYLNRLKFELETIKSMGFIDYFLIVYDYIKYAKINNILVGPGRGSAAGSLVSYVLGITNIDPIKYDLLFERFLNPERITMPDIDIDFEDSRRDEVINYVKEKYSNNKVAPIMTYGTLAAKQVIRDVGKVLKIESNLIDKLTKIIDPKLSLKENANNKNIIKLVSSYPTLKKLYKDAMKLEGLKRHISTHAAGIVISSLDLDDIIPIYKSGDGIMTGFTMEYLEDLGLLKMDFLALRNLTIIKNVVNLINDNQEEKININNISLEDEKTIDIFKYADTEGVFQFESSGMKSFLRKLKADNFSDIYAAIALYRPGPMHNIDLFIERKNGGIITYIDDSLKSILKDTYGIIIYQEQIMQILSKMGNYTFAEADNIRRAMSKKKIEVMEKEKEIFISKAIKNGYSKETSINVYELILKFANYGFNKAHSVSYALIGYQMAYLKCHYPIYFYTNILNMSIGSDEKTKEYISLLKKNDITILKPDINLSGNDYKIEDNKLILPLTLIKGLSSNIVNIITEERDITIFTNYLDFIKRTHILGLKNHHYELLIKSGAMDSFGMNKATMLYNLDTAIDYATLCRDLDEESVLKPVFEEKEENEILNNMELEIYGFYINNHPTIKYQTIDIIKTHKFKEYFDKKIKSVVIINYVKNIKTKKNEDMAIFKASDETGVFDYVIFPRQKDLISKLKNGKIITVHGFVSRRDYEYQVVVNNIEEIGE